ncbi:hypothetical protein HHI36_009726, partial [Cryptolaemus montrouzieri]
RWIGAQIGVSIAIKKKYKRNIKTWEQYNERIFVVELEMKKHSLVIIEAYGLSNDSPIIMKNEFFDDLSEILDSISQRKRIVFLGDLYGRTGHLEDDTAVGKFGEDILNDS